MSWNCARCSFLNHPDLRYCEICEFSAESDSDKAIVPSTTSSANIVTLLDSPCGVGTTDQQCNAENMITGSGKEVVALDSPAGVLTVNNTSLKTSRPLQTLLPIKACAHAVPGILELIRQSMTAATSSRSKMQYEYVVSSPPCLHVSQKGSYGSAWSCGYRNIQMLCSSLMQLEEYQKVLFDGTGVVPEINGIQRWIETAWKAGFDVMVRVLSYQFKTIYLHSYSQSLFLSTMSRVLIS